MKQKIDNDKRNRLIIEDLSLKNRDLTIELNNNMQKFQFDIQKTKVSYAKRTSVMAVTLLTKYNHSSSNRRSSALESLSCAINEKKINENEMNGRTITKNIYKIETEIKQSNNVSEKLKTGNENNNQHKDQKSAKFGSFESQSVKSEKTVSSNHLKQIMAQINPVLFEFSAKKTETINQNQNEIYKIIEDLQDMLKCEEIEKKQMINEQTRLLEKVAQYELKLLNINENLFTAEQEKMEILMQVDRYKNEAHHFEIKYKEAVTQKSKVEDKISRIIDGKNNDQTEIESLRSNVFQQKGKITDLQLVLNDKEHSEKEKYHEFLEEKAKLNFQIEKRNKIIASLQGDFENQKSEKNELIKDQKNLEMKCNRLSLQLAKKDENEAQYISNIRELNMMIDNLNKELLIAKGNFDDFEGSKTSQNKIGFLIRRSINDSFDAENANYDLKSHSSGNIKHKKSGKNSIHSFSLKKTITQIQVYKKSKKKHCYKC